MTHLQTGEGLIKTVKEKKLGVKEKAGFADEGCSRRRTFLLKYGSIDLVESFSPQYVKICGSAGNVNV